MADPFVGQITLTALNFVPRNFAACNGMLLPITQNQALFSLVGTYYGGNGTTNFQLPDLRGRTPVGFSQQLPLGTPGGTETVTLTVQQIPAHVHTATATTATADARSPDKAYFATTSVPMYAKGNPVSIAAIGNAGSSLPHPNMQPYSVLNFCIALQGIYPSRS
ncbi:microcystin-dependent protein [Luteibacter sp. Sphag1AF]|uniref:phage tail protein n=1 Tax=Luteibacter sp. Sphag1AF TaxID=2587031 RepID=UPI0016180320|nr:tail fiber protein [Luteibacter sp. Sphag1AF]MBB3226604.1 microcystin-dependent protein [Luteibacter sp. Sphag1AF]